MRRTSLHRCALALLLAVPGWSLDQLDLGTAAQWYGPVRDRPSVRLQSVFGWETAARDREDDDRSLSRSGGALLVAGRVWRDDQSEAWLRVAGIDIRQDSTLVLPKTGALPDRLQDVRVGGFWRHATSDGRTSFGLDAEISSPSDVPYSGSETLAPSATAFASLPAAQRDAWIIGVRWDYRRSFLPNVPLPVVAYRIDRSPDWNATIGLPFTGGMVRIAPAVRATVTWAIIDTFVATIDWLPGGEDRPWAPTWLVQLGASQTSETWLRADRPDEDRRLLYRTSRVYLAGEWQPLPGNRLRLAGGWMPRRTVQESDSIFSGDNRVSLGDAWFASLGLRLAY